MLLLRIMSAQQGVTHIVSVQYVQAGRWAPRSCTVAVTGPAANRQGFALCRERGEAPRVFSRVIPTVLYQTNYHPHFGDQKTGKEVEPVVGGHTAKA